MSDEIKEALKEQKLTIGTEKTLKDMKAGTVKKVFLASNCPENIVEQVEYYANISGVKVVKLDIPDKEIGLICKKPFAVSVLSY